MEFRKKAQRIYMDLKIQINGKFLKNCSFRDGDEVSNTFFITSMFKRSLIFGLLNIRKKIDKSLLNLQIVYKLSSTL